MPSLPPLIPSFVAHLLRGRGFVTLPAAAAVAAVALALVAALAPAASAAPATPAKPTAAPVAAATAPAPAPAPDILGLRVGPIDDERMGIALLLAPAAAGRCGGRVTGTLALYDVPTGSTITATLGPGPAACELATSLPWSSLSSRILERARADAVGIRIRGERADGGKPQKIDWGTVLPRAQIELTEPMKTTLRRFVRASDIRLGQLGLRATTVQAGVAISSPLHFDLNVVDAQCTLEINGSVVASGSRGAFVVAAHRRTQVEVPVTLNHGALLSAAGSTLLKGGKVEGRLTGSAKLRLPGGDVDFPLELPVDLSLL